MSADGRLQWVYGIMPWWPSILLSLVISPLRGRHSLALNCYTPWPGNNGVSALRIIAVHCVTSGHMLDTHYVLGRARQTVGVSFPISACWVDMINRQNTDILIKFWTSLVPLPTLSQLSANILTAVDIMVHSHTRCAWTGWDALVIFSGGDTLSYQRSPSHRIPAQRVCECTIILTNIMMKLVCSVYRHSRWTEYNNRFS